MASGASRRTERTALAEDQEGAVRKRILATISGVRIQDVEVARALVRERQEREVDKYDEVWDGVYVVAPRANNPQQRLVGAFTSLLTQVVTLPGHGDVLPGANISDRRAGWEQNYRDPDVVVVLKGGRAVDCGTHWMGGPDFLIEIQSPRDTADEKIPFYGRLEVRELLIVHRDTRQLRLYRHDSRQLVAVEVDERKELVSAVVPLAFRRRMVSRRPQTVVRRTDGAGEEWIV